jgi:hypothetical protein
MSKNLASEDFRDSLMGEHGWKAGLTAGASMFGDALGMVPGVGALAKAGSEAGLAVAVARESGEAMAAGAKVSAFTSKVVPAFSYKALDVATSSGVRDYALSGVNLVANSASSLESAGVLPDDGIGHDSAEATKAASAMPGVPGAIAGIRADLGELVRSIRL